MRAEEFALCEAMVAAEGATAALSSGVEAGFANDMLKRRERIMGDYCMNLPGASEVVVLQSLVLLFVSRSFVRACPSVVGAARR